MSDTSKQKGESGIADCQSPSVAQKGSHAQLYNISHFEECVSRRLQYRLPLKALCMDL